MWSTEYSTETGLAAPAIWAALSDLHHGLALDGNSDRFELHGPFAVGTELTVTPQGRHSTPPATVVRGPMAPRAVPLLQRLSSSGLTSTMCADNMYT